MKKILFFLTIFLGLANSLFAIDLGTHERAKIVQISIVNDGGFLYQVSQPVEYEDWNSAYPYDRFKYSGQVNNWGYTTDFSNYYQYQSWFINYLNPDYAQYTLITVEMPSYTPIDFKLQRGSAGVEIIDPVCENGYCTYIDSNSQNVRNYEMVTQVNTSNGSADLYNTVTFNRRNY